MSKKPAADLSGLVATKGSAAPVANMTSRTPAHAEETTAEDPANNVPLNFRVPGEFRRRFRMYAAAHDLKLNELLRMAFDDYEKKHS